MFLQITRIYQVEVSMDWEFTNIIGTFKTLTDALEFARTVPTERMLDQMVVTEHQFGGGKGRVMFMWRSNDERTAWEAEPWPPGWMHSK